jgi:pimeloyl-[acyl-carrier protein] methyl ester esterase
MTIRDLFLGASLAAALIVPGWTARAADQAKPLFAGDKAAVRDRFSDEIAGTGPDLVFIPGLASSRETWKATAERLKGRYRLHLIQIAGFAGEPARANASGPVLVPTAEAIDRYLVAQHLTPATLIGHSLGGTITLYLVEHHPADIKKAMLVDTLPFTGMLTGGPQATVAGVTPMAEKARANPMPMTPQQSKRMTTIMATSQANKDIIAGWSKASDPSTVANAFADDLELDMRPGLAAITTPITLVYPDYAPVGFPPGSVAANRQAAYAADKTMIFVPISNALHFAMWDQPAQFNAALDRFLAN